MNKNYYVTLTGGKNNAGDFLIKYRAFNLFKKFRKDRAIIDFNEWEPIDDEKLKIINNSKALILLGGPGILPHMYPNTYPLRENLNDIKVPVIMMGLGWKDPKGDWENTHNIHFDDSTKELLNKINKSGYLSSVRDYHTLNTLQLHNYKNVLMTGCPAYYVLEKIEQSPEMLKKVKKVAFSLGVSFVLSKSMEKQMKKLILSLKKIYTEQKSEFEVVFHHSLKEKNIQEIYGKGSLSFYKKHQEFYEWLESNDIISKDISGSADNLMAYYSQIDIHIGYRVHAHIFMNSISKFSILISEDGRAKAVRNVIGGIVLDGYLKFKTHKLSGRLNKYFQYDRYISNDFLNLEVLNSLEYEKKVEYNSVIKTRKQIDTNFEIMKKFIAQLP